jgi:hypothetical protein
MLQLCYTASGDMIIILCLVIMMGLLNKYEFHRTLREFFEDYLIKASMFLLDLSAILTIACWSFYIFS